MYFGYQQSATPKCSDQSAYMQQNLLPAIFFAKLAGCVRLRNAAIWFNTGADISR
jgi:hypothetical protein